MDQQLGEEIASGFEDERISASSVAISRNERAIPRTPVRTCDGQPADAHMFREARDRKRISSPALPPLP
jgi:hypothetical protein